MALHADDSSHVLWEDGERVVRRGWRMDDSGKRRAVLTVLAAAETRASLDRLAHEYQLRDELDSSWALRPLELVSHAGRTMLVLEDAGGEPLDRHLGAPMEVARFLSLAIAIAEVVGKLHQRGLVHKDIKPANILRPCRTRFSIMPCARGRPSSSTMRRAMGRSQRIPTFTSVERGLSSPSPSSLRGSSSEHSISRTTWLRASSRRAVLSC